MCIFCLGLRVCGNVIVFWKMWFSTKKTAFFQILTWVIFCSPCPYLPAPKNSALYLLRILNGTRLNLVASCCYKKLILQTAIFDYENSVFQILTRVTFCSPCPYLLAPKKSALYLLCFLMAHVWSLVYIVKFNLLKSIWSVTKLMDFLPDLT